jgi:hypothetical protein
VTETRLQRIATLQQPGHSPSVIWPSPRRSDRNRPGTCTIWLCRLILCLFHYVHMCSILTVLYKDFPLPSFYRMRTCRFYFYLSSRTHFHCLISMYMTFSRYIFVSKVSVCSLYKGLYTLVDDSAVRISTWFPLPTR